MSKIWFLGQNFQFLNENIKNINFLVNIWVVKVNIFQFKGHQDQIDTKAIFYFTFQHKKRSKFVNIFRSKCVRLLVF